MNNKKFQIFIGNTIFIVILVCTSCVFAAEPTSDEIKQKGNSQLKNMQVQFISNNVSKITCKNQEITSPLSDKILQMISELKYKNGKLLSGGNSTFSYASPKYLKFYLKNEAKEQDLDFYPNTIEVSTALVGDRFIFNYSADSYAEIKKEIDEFCELKFTQSIEK